MKTTQKNYEQPKVFKYGYIVVVLLLIDTFYQIIGDSIGFFLDRLSLITPTEVAHYSVKKAF